MKKKNPYAEMYILRPDGRYQGYYRDQDGKRHSVCDKDPEKLYDKIQAKLQIQKKEITFRDIAEAWHDSQWEQIREGTKQSYTAPYNRACERFGDDLPNEITVKQINQHLMQMSNQGFSRSTIKIQKIVYSLIFKYGIINDMATENPATYAIVPASAKKAEKRAAPQDDTIQKIKDSVDCYFGLFPLFLLCTGFRRGEALAVKWENVDFQKGNISCLSQIQSRTGVSKEVPTKSEAGIRTVPLLPILREHLEMPENAKPTDYIFFGENPEKPMPESTYNRRWKHYLKDTGLNLTAHELRHGYATLLFEAGVDEHTAMHLMGHSNIQITMEVYTHLREQKQNSSIEKFEQYASQIFGV